MFYNKVFPEISTVENEACDIWLEYKQDACAAQSTGLISAIQGWWRQTDWHTECLPERNVTHNRE